VQVRAGANLMLQVLQQLGGGCWASCGGGAVKQQQHKHNRQQHTAWSCNDVCAVSSMFSSGSSLTVLG
jgi:hypothetical protein